MKKLHLFLQYLIPQHLFSRIVGFFGRCRCVWWKNVMINKFIKAYKVNMYEALNSDPKSYACFNDFFIRQLKPNARVISESVMVSPADGCISQFGSIHAGQLLQAKGHEYSLQDLLAGRDDLVKQFSDGQFITIYLSPKDYHRVHMPMKGRLREMTYVPGKLFSVNTFTAESVPNLFACNERLITVFDTEHGPMIQILVGAMIVASIGTPWSGDVSPPFTKDIRHWDYQDETISLARGEEMGYFKMGSTVITLFSNTAPEFLSSLQAGDAIKLGTALSI